MSKALKEFQPIRSTNGTGNIITLVLLALAAAFGVGEDLVNQFMLAATPLFLAIREIIQSRRKPIWVGNIATYLGSAVILLFPTLGGIVDALQPIVDAIAQGNINAIWTLLIPLVNQVLVFIRTRNNKGDTKPASYAK